MVSKGVQVSVIVPAYNVEDRIAICLGSLVAQTTDQSFEVIVVNDGSTDRTAEIINGFERKYSNIKVIHKDNGGVSSARNKGLDIALGKWIMFVDADDYLDARCLERMLSHLQDDQYQLVIVGFRLENEIHQEDRNKVECFVSPKGISKLICLNQWETKLSIIGPWGKLFKNDLIKRGKLKFDETISIAEDTLFVLNYYSKIDKAICYYNQDYVYWRSKNSLSAYGEAPVREIIEARLLVLKIQEKLFIKFRTYLPVSFMQSNVIDSTKIILLNSIYSKLSTREIITLVKQFTRFDIVKESITSIGMEQGMNKVIACALKYNMYFPLMIILRCGRFLRGGKNG